jgi:hypothetical protein
MRLKATAAATVAVVIAGATGVALLAATNGAATDQRATQRCRGTFVASSRLGIQAAVEKAAVRAVKTNVRCKGNVVRVARIDLLLENPTVKEYGVTLVGSG